jgi:hypothetical protein
MKRLIFLTALVVLGALPQLVLAENFDATLSGFEEVHFAGGPPATLRGAISTGASGRFRGKFDESSEVITYELSYQALRGAVTQAHIHLGQRHTVGGIMVWLCQTEAEPAPPAVSALTPDCPAEGTVTGKITPAQLLTLTAQGFEEEFGDFNTFVDAMRSGAAYANVHSVRFGPGEIRGQISSSKKRQPKD